MTIQTLAMTIGEWGEFFRSTENTVGLMMALAVLIAIDLRRSWLWMFDTDTPFLTGDFICPTEPHDIDRPYSPPPPPPKPSHMERVNAALKVGADAGKVTAQECVDRFRRANSRPWHPGNKPPEFIGEQRTVIGIGVLQWDGQRWSKATAQKSSHRFDEDTDAESDDPCMLPYR